METDTYLTLRESSTGSYKDKGSRFLAFAFPIRSQDDVKPIIEKIRKEYHDARHHCFAYMLGQQRDIWRVNDDGEPSGTAGKPILGQINSAGLTNILIVVSRYFGGTLLGVSGLINAYRSAAEDAIRNSVIIELSVVYHYELSFPYGNLNDVMRILKEENVVQTRHNFDLQCSIDLKCRASASGRLLKRLSRINDLTVTQTGTE